MAMLQATILAANEGKFYKIGYNLNTIVNIYFGHVRGHVEELKANSITGKEINK
jgi:hypothetical protein